MLGLTINLSRSRGLEAGLVGGWGFIVLVIGLIGISRLAVRAEGPFSLDVLKHRYRRHFSRPLASRLISFAAVVTGRDVFAFVFALLILVRAPMVPTYLFAFSSTIWLLFVVAAFVPPRHDHRARERSA
jgi:hypothetical protein